MAPAIGEQWEQSCAWVYATNKSLVVIVLSPASMREIRLFIDWQPLVGASKAKTIDMRISPQCFQCKKESIQRFKCTNKSVPPKHHCVNGYFQYLISGPCQSSQYTRGFLWTIKNGVASHSSESDGWWTGPRLICLRQMRRGREDLSNPLHPHQNLLPCFAEHRVLVDRRGLEPPRDCSH